MLGVLGVHIHGRDFFSSGMSCRARHRRGGRAADAEGRWVRRRSTASRPSHADVAAMRAAASIKHVPLPIVRRGNTERQGDYDGDDTDANVSAASLVESNR